MAETYDVMVLCAHPDDAEFGAAGTVAKWTNEGRKVVYAICTNGDKGSGDRSLTPERIASAATLSTDTTECACRRSVSPSSSVP